MLAAAAASLALAGAGFFALCRAQASQPLEVLTGSEDLQQALEAAPWIGAEEAPRALAWLVAAPACAGEAPAHPVGGVAVRIIMAAPADATAAERACAVALARARVGAGDPLAPGEEEGYLAWGREAEDRIAAVTTANGAPLPRVAVLWKSGPAWRVGDADAPHMAARALADLKSRT
jgi:hypothetical protein